MFSICTRNIVLGSASTTSPSTSIFSSLTANSPRAEAAPFGRGLSGKNSAAQNSRAAADRYGSKPANSRSAARSVRIRGPSGVIATVCS